MCEKKMTERDGKFAGGDPFDIARRWLEEAEASEPNDPNAMALATVDADGLPNVRMVLLKEIEDNGFVFYTNYGSAKGQELAATGKAALVMHWKSLRRQVRVRGLVEREDGPEKADAYYNSRSLQKPARGMGERISPRTTRLSRASPWWPRPRKLTDSDMALTRPKRPSVLGRIPHHGH